MKRTTVKQPGHRSAISFDEFSIGKNRQLRYAFTKPRLSPVQGTVIFLQDWGQPVEAGRSVMDALSERGFYATSFDWFGSGYSAPDVQNRTIHPLERLRFDPEKLNIFLQNVVLPDFSAPLFVLAQGAGGLFALTAHNLLLNQIRRMVIISPQLEVRGWQAGSLYHYYLHCMIMLGLESSRWHNEAAVEDVLSARAQQSTIESNPHWSKSVLDSISHITSPVYCEQMAVPTLFITSNRDSRSDPSKTRRLANQLRFAQTVSIPGATPSLLDDKPFYRNQFWAAFDAFIPGTGAPAIDRMLEDSIII